MNTDYRALLTGYGYRLDDTPESILQYRQKAHPRGKIWILWAITSLLGVGMAVRAIIMGSNQDLLIAVAATAVAVVLAWNNHRLYTRPFQAIIQLGPEGLTLVDRKQSLNFPSESLEEFMVMADQQAAMLFVKLENQSVKPLLLRFIGKSPQEREQDIAQMKLVMETLTQSA